MSGIALSLLCCLGGLTLLKSVTTTRTERDVRRVRRWFADRVATDDPDWESAVTDLSATKRRILTDLLEDHLRNASAVESPELQSLAAALDVEPEFETVPPRRGERLENLKWATLLEYSVDPDTLTRYVTDDRDEREAAARLLLASDGAAASRRATELLLAGGSLSVFGLDALYRHHRSDASGLLRVASDRQAALEPVLLMQLLTVAGECGRPADELIPWVVDWRSHDSARVRAAASRALVAWDGDRVRETTDVRSGDVAETVDDDHVSRVRVPAPGQARASGWNDALSAGFWNDAVVVGGAG
ncbi:hypothetical protein [Natronoglomus mannanivorans]|uniref:HEAT repeat-containing protein n=1 Tax=Natronoglomus mannanivorans TaxID=2979990 RepID=A0AAP2Z062_9EURY|nr:hypothetical protein [Halobacteria archaeon AArc-xg1-1]